MLEHWEHFRKLSQNIQNTSKLTSHAAKFIFSSKNGTRLWAISLKLYNANPKTASGSLGRVMAWKGVEILRGQFQRTLKLWILIQNFWVKDWWSEVWFIWPWSCLKKRCKISPSWFRFQKIHSSLQPLLQKLTFTRQRLWRRLAVYLTQLSILSKLWELPNSTITLHLVLCTRLRK